MDDYGKTRFGSRILYVLTVEDAQTIAKDTVGKKLTEEELCLVQKGVESGFGHQWTDIMSIAIEEAVRESNGSQTRTQKTPSKG